MSVADRRRHDRITFFTEAWLEGLDVSRVPCRLGDLSVGGAFVDARTNLPPGTRIVMRFRVADREVTAIAEVRYAAPGIGMGLPFLAMSDDDRELISSTVRANLPPDHTDSAS